MDLLADTGNPCPIIISSAALKSASQKAAPDLNSNFGPLEGGWITVSIPDIGLTHLIMAFGSDEVVTATKASSSDFEGLAGLPLLRLMEYGGNADWFWLRAPQIENDGRNTQ